MDSKTYNAGLAELRGMRDDIKELAKELASLETDRDKLVVQLGGYPKANADRLAPAAGLAVADVVALAPHLGPQETVSALETPQEDARAAAPQSEAQAPAPAIEEPVGAVAPDLRSMVSVPAVAAEGAEAAGAEGGQEQDQDEAVVDGPAPELEQPAAAAAETAAAVPQQATTPAPAPAKASTAGQDRVLPSIPEGAAGDRWTVPTPGLVSKRPTFTQQVRQMAFLDTLTGVLVFRDQQVRVDLGSGTVAEILTAVYCPDREGSPVWVGLGGCEVIEISRLAGPPPMLGSCSHSPTAAIR